MGARVYLKTWKEYFLVAIGSIIFLLHSPTLLDFSPIPNRPSFMPMTGPLEVNDKLTQAEHLYENILNGPESIVAHEGNLYTGTADGRIMMITKDNLVAVSHTGQDCKLPYEGKLCGRPLGLRMGKDGLLYVLDAYYGLHRLNTTAGTLTRLMSTNSIIEGQRILFPDDLDIDEDGNVYISDASAKWDLSDIWFLVAEAEGSGRVIRFNIYTGEKEVILRNLYFPNGIQISHDGNSLLISELIQRRILKYYLKGAKKGQLEVLIDHLPGEPDNIRPSSSGGYWVAISTARNDTNPTIFDRLAPFSTICRVLGRAQHAIGSILFALSDILSYHPFKEFAYKVKKGEIVLPLLHRHGIIIEIDDNGKILRSYQSPDGSVSLLSQVTEHDGYLYLGSFVNHFMGRLQL